MVKKVDNGITLKSQHHCDFRLRTKSAFLGGGNNGTIKKAKCLLSFFPPHPPPPGRRSPFPLQGKAGISGAFGVCQRFGFLNTTRPHGSLWSQVFKSCFIVLKHFDERLTAPFAPNSIRSKRLSAVVRIACRVKGCLHIKERFSAFSRHGQIENNRA